MIKLKYSILAIVAMLSSQGIRADEQKSEMFREDLRWNYLIKTPMYAPDHVSRMKFDGVREYEGMTYHCLVEDYSYWADKHPDACCRQYEAGSDKPVLIRLEEGKVFARLPDYRSQEYSEEKDYVREVQLYDINCVEGDTFESLSDEGEIVEMKVTKVEHVSVDGKSLRLLTVMPVKETSARYEEGDFLILENVGIVRGGCLWFVLSPMPTGAPGTRDAGILNYGRPDFYCLTTDEGNVVYSNKYTVGDFCYESVGIERDREWEYATVREIPSETKDEVMKEYTLSTYRVEGIERIDGRIYSRLCLVGEKNWTVTFKAGGVFECSPVTDNEKHECMARIRSDEWNLYMLPTEENISYIKPPYTDFQTRLLAEGEELLLYPGSHKKDETVDLWFGYNAQARLLDVRDLKQENSPVRTEIKAGNLTLSADKGVASGSLTIDKTYVGGVGNTGLGTFWNPKPNDDLSQYERYEPRTFFNNMYGINTNNGEWELLYKGADISPENPGAVGGIAADNVDDNDPAAVYDLCGRKVMNDASESDLRNLPKGIYIYKGRKIII